MKGCNLGKDLKDVFIDPAELATTVVAAFGMRGSGKTNLMAVIAEELRKAGIQVVILDYVGVWFSLRLDASGKKPSGLDIAVLGGPHGDISLTPKGGALVATALAQSGKSAVLDISQWSKGQREGFATDFAETLFSEKKKLPGPCFLILEEAQRFAPQKLRPDQARMLGAIEEIAEVGRNFGLGVGLISQRPEKVNTDVRNLAEVLFAFQTNGPHERKAIQEWVQEHDAEGRDDVKNQLPGLQRGQAYVWSPGMLRLYRKVQIRMRETFAANATPTQARATIKMHALDLGQLEVSLKAVVEETKANDPRALRAKIVELERQVAALHHTKRSGGGETVKVVERVSPAVRRSLAAVAKKGAQAAKMAAELCVAIEAVSKEAELSVDKIQNGVSHSTAPAGATVRVVSAPPVAAARGVGAVDGDANGLSRAARALLVAVAQMGGQASDSQISILSGYSITSSSFSNAKSELRTAGFIDGTASLRRLTDAGRSVTTTVPPAPSGVELLDWWCNKLGKCEATLLRTIYDAGGAASKEKLSEWSGYSITSSSFSNGLSTLRTAGLVSGSHGSDLTLAESFQ